MDMGVSQFHVLLPRLCQSNPQSGGHSEVSRLTDLEAVAWHLPLGGMDRKGQV